jgi:hypothetical protein
MCDVAEAESLAEFELILALDASGSMFDQKNEGIPNWNKQIAGHVYALSQPEVIDKLIGGRVYLRIVLWSDGKIYPILFDALVQSTDDLERAKNALENYRPPCAAVGCGGTNHSTAIARALAFAPKGYLRVLDISTDEQTHTEYRVHLETLRDEFSEQDGTINVLAVGMAPANEADLQKNLCTKHGFCFSAKSWSDYAEALKRKIITEIA